MYAAIEKAFHSGWHHPVYHPPWVIAIHAILPSEQASGQYEAVRFSNVSSKESRLYRTIVEGGFRLPRPGHAKPVNPNGRGRFGRAITPSPLLLVYPPLLSKYTTPVSSKAADYERKRNPCKNIAKRDRHVLVARVATGRMHNLLTDEPNRRGARQGYDSIIAPAGFSVNYTEHAVYKDYGALPNFV
ncbi:unnamed protein product [Tilletia controversa]|nr:unnamed protein product [Tilletia controversa]CAD6979667.1 unnamed protein product [Tilletia controversa]